MLSGESEKYLMSGQKLMTQSPLVIGILMNDPVWGIANL